MKFRDADPADAEQIAQLHAASWRHVYRGILSESYLNDDVFADRSRVWQERFAEPKQDQSVLLATEEETVLGFACLFGYADARFGSMLDNLHVLPDLRGRGIGTQLIARAAERAQRRYPAAGFFLWVFAKNEPARRFYERLGGTLSETVEADAPGGGRAIECRYTWTEPQLLVDRIESHS